MPHYYSSFPVRTLDALRSVAREYLDTPLWHQPGPSRVAFGPMLITPQATTLVTVRISEREATPELCTNSVRGKSHQVWRNVYKAVSTAFVVIELDGRAGTIEELASRSTKKEADKAMRAIHAAR